MAAKRKVEETPAEAEPKSYTIDDIYLTAGDETHTIAYWLYHDKEAATTKAADVDGNDFEYDDLTGHPGDVQVYTNGRPD